MPSTRSHDSALTTRSKDTDTDTATTTTTTEEHAPGAAPVEKSHRASATDCTQHWEDEEHLAQNKRDFQSFRAAHRKASASSGSSAGDTVGSAGSDGSGDHGEVPGGMKRGRGANQVGSMTKKVRSGEVSGLAKGDKTRVPGVGQRVFWGEGEEGVVREVLVEDEVVEGVKTEASKEDPRLVVEREGGKVVIKPEEAHFE